MKKIINIFIIFSVSIVFSHSTIAQCSDTRKYDIYTPNGSAVETWLTCESSTSIRQGFDTYYTQTYPNAQKIITYDNEWTYGRNLSSNPAVFPAAASG
jgi:hypothetical protein